MKRAKSLVFNGLAQIACQSQRSHLGNAGLDDVSVVVFRGTDDAADWIVNLDIRSTLTPHGPIHRGFYEFYQPLGSQIVQILSRAEPKHVWITGHSLGGALALVCAYDLIENQRKEIDGLITFGQPMVARNQLAAHLNGTLLGKYAHYVNRSDIVPRIPPRFTHCGSLIWFTGDGIRRSKPMGGRFVVADEPTDADDIVQIMPMQPEEFEQLQTELRAAIARDTLPNGTLQVRGNIPWLRNHDMIGYVQEVSNTLNFGQ